ncbi:peptidoglycan editing factor PgeF [Anabaena cylindrica FACHB-243]|uniref:Purine nucleoside phosphorylase n=1 Tax=Anabaena cylindrica (strain ATCC 27899 / PCC 7122) TaxID=272123 RepID=K9ZDP6_ANACC|nr:MULTISPECIES: peptidoglycan editing factor PgeF [Anabaena]AFZ57301.1 Multi-copper polyphenol oxidoreductase, laccase [Anabaena cylindrica PCC 7122]MBD2420969.1 peptidoglycan editing factor PgeF [Anabaena cylindrica FACHB-243]MBY5283430.1 peptidoglycan editing factor PgeF [Anabaena sp. CCAP 1446/1C]MBY5311279.1 peptidoglycan editing factor PgeF [Anabaena sp. CCAP 1446/1C]MCM2405722.1 peptidoglycan editing factor PgeF [Anabaena sp. CCAP 1446/1C]
MHTWHWHNWEGLPYLTCNLLEPWPHGFFTQQFWPRPPHELTQVLQPQALAYRLQQVHGNTVLTPQEVDEQLQNSDDLALADGLISDQALQAIWVASADCTPVLIGDVKIGQVAALHAGWRGTAAKIVPQAIARMQSQGSELADLRIAMGPAIAGEVYQVSVEVAAEIGCTILPHNDQQNIVAALHNLPDSPLLADPEPGKVRLDVRRINALQLEQLGISGEQIAIAPYCTYQTPEHFFSYRREKEKKVQWSGIVSLPASAIYID